MTGHGDMHFTRVIEMLTLPSLALAVAWRGLGGRVYYLDVADRMAGSALLEYLETRGWIQKLDLDPGLRRHNNPAVDAAFADVEQLAIGLQEHPIIRECVALYGDPDVMLAFKKKLLAAVAEVGFYERLAEGIERLMGSPWRFVPARPWVLWAIDSPSARRLRRLVPWWFRAVGRTASWADGLKAMAVCAVAALGAVGRRREGVLREDYPFAISIISPIRQFANPIRGVDFLLDGERLTKANTLFVPLVSLAPVQRQRLAEAGFAIATVGGGGSVPRHEARRLAGYALRILSRLPTTAPWTTLPAAVLVREYAKWTGFLRRYQIGHFVSHADFGMRHIGRNVLLRRSGARTWYYVDTVNTSDIFNMDVRGAFRRHEYWAYLLYDTCVTWSGRHAEFLRAHHPRIGEFLSVGCLWSEHVRLIQEGSLRTSLRDVVMGPALRPDMKIVGVFDSSYRNDSLTTYDDGVEFLHGIERLLEDCSNIYVVWKEKKSRRDFVRRESRKLADLYGRLSRHPRCYFPGFEASPSEVIALSDLVISFPFTSPTVEAVCAARRGIYYDATGKFVGAYYDRIPGFVAHDYQQLRALVGDLLYKTDEDAYRRFLERYVKDDLDPFLDGRAITRLREALWRSTSDRALLGAQG